MKTNYLGKTIGNRVLVICANENGEYIQCPHVDMMREDGLVLRGFEGTPNGELRYLTQEEVACFISGKGTDGAILETPAEARLRHEKEHAELLKDPKYKNLFEQLKKEMAA